MADYTTDSSFEVTGLTAEETAWLQRAEYLIEAAGYLDDDPPADELAELMTHMGWDKPPDQDTSWGWTSYYDGDTVAFYADCGQCNVEYMAEVLHRFLNMFPNRPPIGFMWADACSKPRIGSFGGGAVLVTRDGSEFHTTGQWLDAALTRSST